MRFLSFDAWLALAASIVVLERRLRAMQNRLSPAFSSARRKRTAAENRLISQIRAKKMLYNRWAPVYEQLL